MIESVNMFDGKKYKKHALLQLKKHWCVPCLIALLCFAIVGCMNAASKTFWPAGIISICVFGMMFVAQLSVFFKIVNFKSDDEKNPENKISFKDFLKGFDDWLTSFLGILWFCLWTWLWSLLLFIPGIIKSLSYLMMFWVISENPGISVRKAMNISKIMTAGHKGELFCLFISFFGWFLLCCLSCGIGFIWLCPYVLTTLTNAYYDLKIMALETKKLKPADFYVIKD